MFFPMFTPYVIVLTVSWLGLLGSYYHQSYPALKSKLKIVKDSYQHFNPHKYSHALAVSLKSN